MNICPHCMTHPCCCTDLAHHHTHSHVWSHLPQQVELSRVELTNLITAPIVDTGMVSTNLCNCGKCNQLNSSCNCADKKDSCPTNKPISIAKIGNKLIISMNDCTYYEVDLSVLDMKSINATDVVVTKVSYDSIKHSITVTYRNNQTGDETEVVANLNPEIHLVKGSIDPKLNKLVLVNNDSSVVEIPLDAITAGITNNISNIIDNAITSTTNNIINNLKSQKIEKTELVGTTYTITLSNSDKFSTDFSALINGADKYVKSGAVLNNKKLTLTFNDSSTIDIDLSALVTSSSTVLITGGKIVGNNMVLDLSDNTKINIDITELLKQAVDTVTNNIQTTIVNNATNHIINNILKLGYAINTQTIDYATVDADLNGRTLIRCDKNGNQTITINKPDPATDAEKVGTAVIVRKTNGAVGTTLTLVAGSGVTLSPVDATILRRVGSSVTLVYVGSGVWDIFGELP